MKFHLLLTLSVLSQVSALHGLKAKLSPLNSPQLESQQVSGKPVYSSDYLPDYKAAQDATAVDFASEGWNGPIQHSGFLSFKGERPAPLPAPSVNTFFWYLPSLDLNPDAPTLMWLQGGPGGSSLYGMFSEIGPMGIDGNMTIFERSPAFNWNQKYNLLFLDNPCGVGFSHSNEESCFVTNEVQVGSDLRFALLQFFEMFPNLRKNDFYATGESYAGKYVPAVSSTIHSANAKLSPDDKDFINIKGMAIGDGAMDPPSQFNKFSDLLYYNGLANAKERKVFQQYEANIQNALAKGDTIEAFNQFDVMLNGDFIQPTYYMNVTGMTNYFNSQQGDCGSCEPEYYGDWVVDETIRSKIHVGDVAYNSFNETVEVMLKGDWMVGVVDMITPLLNDPDFKVLIYSGQIDIILGAPLTEQFLDSLEWDGDELYSNSEKQIWKIDDVRAKEDPVAGYVNYVEKYQFTYAVVRGAGHLVPLDQEQRAFDMIERFVENNHVY